MSGLSLIMLKPLTFVTRASALAQAQTNLIQEILNKAGLSVKKTITVTTTGDHLTETSLSKIGGKGLFVKELEHALFEKKADIAVHSLKDLPLKSETGLVLAGFFTTDSPFDALISLYEKLEDLPKGATVGTSSLRRATQLSLLRPDLSFSLLRGNVLTRLDKFYKKKYDAIILAEAGLARLKIETRRTLFSQDQVTPAFNQGIIAVQCREQDSELIAFLKEKTKSLIAIRVLWERSLAQLFNASCESAFGIYADIQHEDPLMVVVTIFAYRSKNCWKRKTGHFHELKDALLWACEVFELSSIDWSCCECVYF
jgi:hydroxymethylbilane synthase